jgi:putative exporter of polyketide antibiotics
LNSAAEFDAPFEHIARLPLAELTWAPLIVLTVIAAVVAALSLYGLRKRDIEGNWRVSRLVVN